MSACKQKKIKVALTSCGLGNVNRGFEVSTARWHRALSKQGSLDVRLFCGAKHDDATAVWNLNRDSLLAGPLAFFPFLTDRRRWELCYGIEQISFGVSFLPELLKWKPDVVWTKEAPFSHILDTYRKLLRLDYKIIFANGGAFKPGTYQQFDYIQHMQPDSYEQGLKFGIPANKMTTLCNCVPYVEIQESRAQIRQSLGYADSDWVIASTAAWNKYHKRIDYLLKEVASLNCPSARLLLIGHPDAETPELKKLAQDILPGRVDWHTLANPEVHRALRAADVFVLTSLDECLGGAMIEAAMASLPIISHPHPGARYILEDDFWMTDLSQPGNLARKLESIRNNPVPAARIEALKAKLISRFDEHNQAEKFCEMVQSVIGSCNQSTETRRATAMSADL